MKPDSIKRFDWLYLGSVAVGIASVVLQWDAIVAATTAEVAAAGATEFDDDMALGAVIFGTVVGVGISLILWLLISVFRIEIVKWLLCLLAAWSLANLPSLFSEAQDIGLAAVLSLVSTLLSLVALYFLFRSDAKEWFAAKRAHDED